MTNSKNLQAHLWTALDQAIVSGLTQESINAILISMDQEAPTDTTLSDLEDLIQRRPGLTVGELGVILECSSGRVRRLLKQSQRIIELPNRGVADKKIYGLKDNS